MENHYQEDERNKAIAKRVAKNRRKGATCLCDWCDRNEGTTQHEIFPRGLTREGTEKRDACLSRYVISMLCPICHAKIQTDAQANRDLLEFNRNLWGADKVDDHIAYMDEIGVRVTFQDRV